jgi:hypothetical protein
MFLLPFIVLFSQIFTTYQLQPTAPIPQQTITVQQLQPATATIQGDQQDTDNLQPALGYNALNSSQGIVIQ